MAHRLARPDGRDERGSIVMVLFIIITASILVLTVAGIAISQQVVSQRTVARTDALEAADAGLDAAVGELRAASASSTGEVEDLPCTGTPTDGFTLTGYLDTTSGTTYTATVTYYGNVEPTPANIAAHLSPPVACFAGTSSSFPSAVPNYAVIESIGKDPASGPGFVPTRNVEEIYSFHNTNQNIPGGIIEDFNYVNDDLCLADPNAVPAIGDALWSEKCQTAGAAGFTWLYNQNFTIELSSTETSSTPLCIQGSTTTNAAVTLAECWFSPGGTATSYTQQWGIDDSGHYVTVNSGGGNAGLCITQENYPNPANAPFTPSALDLTSCSGSGDSQVWAPTPAVGPGDAGVDTQQFVNYDEFGSCMDVTNQQVGWSYLIDYMCKQFPDGAAWKPTMGTDPYDPTWNQRWAAIGVTGTSYVELQTNDRVSSDPNDPYCLYSPGNGNIADGNVAGVAGNNPDWVVVKACPTISAPVPAADDNFLWKVDTTSTYETTDFWGHCLNADTFDPQQPGGGSYFSTMTMFTCQVGMASEEWNAPPSLSNSGVSNVYEP